MSTVEVERDEDKLKVRYLKILKIIVLLAVIYFIWTVIHIMSVYFLGFYNKWATLTMDQWIISSIIFFSICIGLVLLFVLHHYIIKKRRIESEKPKPVFYKGKRLYTYTLPDRPKGGIFSKTFVKIDDGTTLVLRFQMIPPINLWGKTE
jgi:hypothetical protein